jgi:hypothetical protein
MIIGTIYKKKKTRWSCVHPFPERKIAPWQQAKIRYADTHSLARIHINTLTGTCSQPSFGVVWARRGTGSFCLIIILYIFKERHIHTQTRIHVINIKPDHYKRRRRLCLCAYIIIMETSMYIITSTYNILLKGYVYARTTISQPAVSTATPRCHVLGELVAVVFPLGIYIGEGVVKTHLFRNVVVILPLCICVHVRTFAYTKWFIKNRFSFVPEYSPVR